jgi:hypothetical protein
MNGPSRRWVAALVGILASVPAWPSALVVLAMAPVARWLPPLLLDPLRRAAAVVFGAIARLPPSSLAGRLFYGSFAPLPALFGEASIAVHAALLGVPWLVLALVLARHLARPPRTRARRRRALQIRAAQR